MAGAVNAERSKARIKINKLQTTDKVRHLYITAMDSCIFITFAPLLVRV